MEIYIICVSLPILITLIIYLIFTTVTKAKNWWNEIVGKNLDQYDIEQIMKSRGRTSSLP